MSYGDQSVMDVNLEKYEREQAEKDRQETQRSNEADFAKQECQYNHLLLKKLYYSTDIDEQEDLLKVIADQLAKGTEAKFGEVVTRFDILKDLI